MATARPICDGVAHQPFPRRALASPIGPEHRRDRAVRIIADAWRLLRPSVVTDLHVMYRSCVCVSAVYNWFMDKPVDELLRRAVPGAAP